MFCRVQIVGLPGQLRLSTLDFAFCSAGHHSSSISQL
jgi:hypothetical protein